MVEYVFCSALYLRIKTLKGSPTIGRKASSDTPRKVSGADITSPPVSDATPRKTSNPESSPTPVETVTPQRKTSNADMSTPRKTSDADSTVVTSPRKTSNAAAMLSSFAEAITPRKTSGSDTTPRKLSSPAPAAVNDMESLRRLISSLTTQLEEERAERLQSEKKLQDQIDELAAENKYLKVELVVG